MKKESILLCALGAPFLASASEVGHWYVTPQIGGIRVDDERPLEEEDWLVGLGVGKAVSRGLNIELNLNGAKLDGVPGFTHEFYAGSLDFLGVMNRDGRVSPYVSAGLGALRNEPSIGSNSTDFMTQAGVGLMIKMWESADSSRSFSLRPDFKVRWDDAGAPGTQRDYIGTLGFQYAFGAPAAKPVAALPPPAPAPQPEPPAPPAPPPPPADSDRDGVTDDIDKCPGTPAGVAVDAEGCPRKGSITLEGVTFEVNSATLAGDSRAILTAVAADLAKYPQLRIELQGHTDSSGSDAYNLTLSQRRADSVRAFLIERGIPDTQVVARGYGEGQPISDNTSAEGRAKNRRVVMFVLANPGDVKVQGEGAVQN